MKKSSKLIASIAGVLSIFATMYALPSVRAAGSAVPFKAADLKVETNATDGDAGLQVFLDHEPWTSIVIKRPDRSEILNITTRGVLAEYGLTELFSESSEPPFTEFPVSEFKKLFPDGPRITTPGDGSSVPIEDLVVRWEPVRNLETPTEVRFTTS